MRQREPDRALQASAFRPKGSPCPFGTWLYEYNNTHDPNLPISITYYSVLRSDQNCKSLRPLFPGCDTCHIILSDGIHWK